jgi:hypothetical protein
MKHLQFKVWNNYKKKMVTDNVSEFASFNDDGTICTAGVVGPNCLLQCTGFPDHEGNLIFQGDILKYEHLKGDDVEHLQVIFCNQVGAFQTGLIEHDWQLLSEDLACKDLFKITIAGNIFEHAHLLPCGIYPDVLNQKQS